MGGINALGNYSQTASVTDLYRYRYCRSRTKRSANEGTTPWRRTMPSAFKAEHDSAQRFITSRKRERRKREGGARFKLHTVLIAAKIDADLATRPQKPSKLGRRARTRFWTTSHAVQADARQRSRNRDWQPRGFCSSQRISASFPDVVCRDKTTPATRHPQRQLFHLLAARFTQPL